MISLAEVSRRLFSLRPGRYTLSQLVGAADVGPRLSPGEEPPRENLARDAAAAELAEKLQQLDGVTDDQRIRFRIIDAPSMPREYVLEQVDVLACADLSSEEEVEIESASDRAKEDADHGEAWEQLACTFPAIQADAMDVIPAAQFIIAEHEKALATIEQLSAGVPPVSIDVGSDARFASFEIHTDALPDPSLLEAVRVDGIWFERAHPLIVEDLEQSWKETLPQESDAIAAFHLGPNGWEALAASGSALPWPADLGREIDAARLVDMGFVKTAPDHWERRKRTSPTDPLDEIASLIELCALELGASGETHREFALDDLIDRARTNGRFLDILPDVTDNIAAVRLVRVRFARVRFGRLLANYLAASPAGVVAELNTPAAREKWTLSLIGSGSGRRYLVAKVKEIGAEQ